MDYFHWYKFTEVQKLISDFLLQSGGSEDSVVSNDVCYWGREARSEGSWNLQGVRSVIWNTETQEGFRKKWVQGVCAGNEIRGLGLGLPFLDIIFGCYQQVVIKLWFPPASRAGTAQKFNPRVCTVTHTRSQVWVAPMLVCVLQIYQSEKGSVSMQTIKRPAGVSPEVNLRNPLHSQESTQARDLPWPWNSGQISLEVQNSGPTKRTHVRQTIFLEKIFSCHFLTSSNPD